MRRFVVFCYCLLLKLLKKHNLELPIMMTVASVLHAEVLFLFFFYFFFFFFFFFFS